MLFNREPQDDATQLRHTTLATARLRFLFVAAKIWRHSGRTGVSYSDHYEEKGVFQRLMDRLRKIVPRGAGYARVMLPPQGLATSTAPNNVFTSIVPPALPV